MRILSGNGLCPALKSLARRVALPNSTLIDGERGGEVLAELAWGQMHSKIADLSQGVGRPLRRP